ncbi:MAG: hypothetical protein PHU61_01855 [Candidatus Absconditabacteria bacterium]|nr:hypothetical protein [Candidatus Absconditabacteria bacterium]MDD3868454.1 hypothetical protein [Candidatus Absconditabacteria bacterium]MDD4713972.1 hypothetical protein [Candidatus Absconditabacteria bacterium]
MLIFSTSKDALSYLDQQFAGQGLDMTMLHSLFRLEILKRLPSYVLPEEEERIHILISDDGDFKEKEISKYLSKYPDLLEDIVSDFLAEYLLSS